MKRSEMVQRLIDNVLAVDGMLNCPLNEIANDILECLEQAGMTCLEDNNDCCGPEYYKGWDYE